MILRRFLPTRRRRLVLVTALTVGLALGAVLVVGAVAAGRAEHRIETALSTRLGPGVEAHVSIPTALRALVGRSSPQVEVLLPWDDLARLGVARRSGRDGAAVPALRAARGGLELERPTPFGPVTVFLKPQVDGTTLSFEVASVGLAGQSLGGAAVERLTGRMELPAVDVAALLPDRVRVHGLAVEPDGLRLEVGVPSQSTGNRP
ncbi:hypothetical protein ACIB24_19910 [Spongisporangium articulatum]|uniref:DUF2993 domain-containing protein n=1 Tax=Spongisporangium articulatum TaxID=3362603 RepID=A0ABW8ATB7_9ACTN